MDDGDVARLRAIPLAAVLEGLGAQRDPADPTRNWRYEGSRITVTGDQFYDHNAAGANGRLRDGKSGGGGAIDLVMYLRDVSFRDAMRELGGWDPERIQATAKQANAPAAKTKQSPATAGQEPQADPRMTDQVWKYLTEQRAIPSEIVRRAIDSGKVFADKFANVVFQLTDETGRAVGYELRGTKKGSDYHGVRGDKGLFAPRVIANDGPREAAFVESGIDALSYQAFHPGRLVFSTTGSAIERPVSMGRHLIDRGYQLYAAFDADKDGDRIATRLTEALPGHVTRDRPDPGVGKDWNAVLQAQQRGTNMERDGSDRELPVVVR